MTKKINQLSVFVILVISLLFMVNISILNYIDFGSIIEPLESINSFTDYHIAIKNKKIYDLQPIRDISHKIDLSLSNKMQYIHEVGRIHNLLLLFLTAYFIFKLFTLIGLEKIKAKLYTLLFLSHPAIYEIYIDPSSRKHILATLFFVICCFIYLKDLRRWKKSIVVFLTYCLSIFSHPITLFTPYFFLLASFKNKSIKKDFTVLFPSFVISIVAAYLNYQFYSISYTEMTNLNKVSGGFNLGKTILSFGLHIKQIFLPISFSQYYSTLHIFEFVFFLVFMIGLLLIYRQRKQYTLFYFLFPLLSVMIILYHREIDIIFLNTYVLIPLISFLFFFSQFNIDFKKLIMTILVLLSLSSYRSYIRHDSTRYFTNSYQNQPNCHQLNTLVNHKALSSTDLEDFYFWGKTIINDKCLLNNEKTKFMPFVIMTLIVFSNPKLNIYEKSTKLSRRLVDGDKNFLMDALNIKIGNSDSLLSNFKTYYHSYFIYTIPGNIIKKHCQEKDNDYCNGFKKYRERNKENKIVVKFK